VSSGQTRKKDRCKRKKEQTMGARNHENKGVIVF
jgi:hypothetical protein